MHYLSTGLYFIECLKYRVCIYSLPSWKVSVLFHCQWLTHNRLVFVLSENHPGNYAEATLYTRCLNCHLQRNRLQKRSTMKLNILLTSEKSHNWVLGYLYCTKKPLRIVYMITDSIRTQHSFLSNNFFNFCFTFYGMEYHIQVKLHIVGL